MSGIASGTHASSPAASRTLYHFPQSLFSRRARLLLAHKGLTANLKDARADEQNLAEGKALTPMGTMPVLVEPDGTVLTDSFAIALYLEHAYAGPRLFPSDKDDALLVGMVVTMVDRAMNILVDLGTRYFALRSDPAWKSVSGEQTKRAQGALDELAKLTSTLGRPTIAKSGYGIADMWLLSATLWLEALPGRAPTTPLVQQIVSLGVTLPPALSRWADPHRPIAEAVFA